MKLWPHQQSALEQLDALVQAGSKRICLTSPTGGGKTQMAMERLIHSQVPSVFYTHRKMLLSQTSEKFTEMGIDHGLRASGHAPGLLHDIQLAMIQSESAAIKRGSRELHDATEILIDEAHNNASSQATDIIEGHDCTTIGLTATPLGIGHLYKDLVIAGTNSELRACGAHVPAYIFGPDEPSKDLVGKIAIGEGECGISQRKRQIFAQKVFGSVVEHYKELNPDQYPTLLFAPGIKESIWFCQELEKNGITAAHIDGKNCFVDGELHGNDADLRQEIANQCKRGDIQIVCNRFVLREGVDWPWVRHMIFATVFGSLTSYLQAGGRGLRNTDGKDKLIVQDHGGNWWRHGSLNADRNWRLDTNDRIVSGERLERIREQQDHEPIHCPKCDAIRNDGPKCWRCGYTTTARTRPVIQANGTLKEMTNKALKPRKRMTYSKQVEKQWVGRVLGIQRSKKDTVKSMTFAQAEANFARDNNWHYPPRNLPFMPIEGTDWFRPIQDVPRESLTK